MGARLTCKGLKQQSIYGGAKYRFLRRQIVDKLRARDYNRVKARGADKIG